MFICYFQCVIICALLSVIPEFPNGFPYFLQFKTESCNKELMIWATVTSRSYFHCLYRTSPSLAASNIINLIYILTIRWCSYVESSTLLSEKGVCCVQRVLLTKLLVFAVLHFLLYAKLACFSGCFLTFFFCIPISYGEKNIFFWCY